MATRFFCTNLRDGFEQPSVTLEQIETLFTSQQRFLADVSHELRAPLTVIKGNVDLMRRMKRIDDESRASGFGLGLSITHWIVEHHSGRIEVESKDGMGTTFAIWLPLIGEQ